MAFCAPLGYIGEGDKRELLVTDNFEVSTTMLARRHRTLLLRGYLIGWPMVIGNAISGRTDEHSPVRVVADILAMNMISDEPIKLFVDGPGGDIDVGMELYDVIKLSRAPITTIGISVASMATLLTAVGHKRYALPHSRFMLHLPEGGFSGDPKEAEIHSREMKRIHEMLIDCYLECGITAGLRKKSAEKIKKRLLADIDREHWLSAEEAVHYGIIDRVARMEDLF